MDPEIILHLLEQLIESNPNPSPEVLRQFIAEQRKAIADYCPDPKW